MDETDTMEVYSENWLRVTFSACVTGTRNWPAQLTTIPDPPISISVPVRHRIQP